MKNYFKITFNLGFLLFGLSFLLVSCQDDFFEEIDEYEIEAFQRPLLEGPDDDSTGPEGEDPYSPTDRSKVIDCLKGTECPYSITIDEEICINTLIK